MLLDKFGIFKLLTSFLGQNGQNSTINTPSSPLDANSLLGVFSGESPKKDNPLPPPPLQNKMLSTLSSHDDFVKRVKAKHGNK